MPGAVRTIKGSKGLQSHVEETRWLAGKRRSLSVSVRKKFSSNCTGKGAEVLKGCFNPLELLSEQCLMHISTSCFTDPKPPPNEGVYAP